MRFGPILSPDEARSWINTVGLPNKPRRRRATSCSPSGNKSACCASAPLPTSSRSPSSGNNSPLSITCGPSSPNCASAEAGIHRTPPSRLPPTPHLIRLSRRLKRGAVNAAPNPGAADTRRLKPEAEVARIVELRPAECARCGRKLRGDDPRPERRQVSELPQVKAEAIEYRRHRLRCRDCGAENKADRPAGMPTGGFGPRAQATVGYLTGRLGTSHRDAAEVLGVSYGLQMSTGSVSALQRQVSRALEGAGHLGRALRPRCGLQECPASA